MSLALKQMTRKSERVDQQDERLKVAECQVAKTKPKAAKKKKGIGSDSERVEQWNLLCFNWANRRQTVDGGSKCLWNKWRWRWRVWTLERSVSDYVLYKDRMRLLLDTILAHSALWACFNLTMMSPLPPLALPLRYSVNAHTHTRSSS